MTALELQLLRFPTRGASAHCTQLQRARSGGCGGHWDGAASRNAWAMDGDRDGCTLAAGNGTGGNPDQSRCSSNTTGNSTWSCWAGWHVPIPGSALSCSPPLFQVWFSQKLPPNHPIHDIRLHPACCVLFWMQGGPDPLTRLILRDGPGQWNIPCAPKLWLPTYILQDQNISLDLSDEVTPKLPGSKLSELLTHHSITS